MFYFSPSPVSFGLLLKVPSKNLNNEEIQEMILIYSKIYLPTYLILYIVYIHSKYVSSLFIPNNISLETIQGVS